MPNRLSDYLSSDAPCECDGGAAAHVLGNESDDLAALGVISLPLVDPEQLERSVSWPRYAECIVDFVFILC